MADIFKLFLTVSVTASAMTGIVLLIRRLFSKKMNPGMMPVLWVLVLIRLILPYTFSSPVQLNGLFPQQIYSAGINNTAVPADHMPGIDPISFNGSDASDTDITPVPEIYTPAEAAPAGACVIPGSWLKNIPWWDVSAAVWTAGIFATLFVSVRKAARFKRKLKFCNPVRDEKVLDIIRTHKKATGVKRSVAVMECDFVHAPAVFGYFKPCILIPSRFIKEMDRDSLSAILLHEIYHIRCRDILTNYIWLAAKALHWFNPFVWFACKRFTDDVEMTRDRKAARALDADGEFIYSRSLLEAARFSRLAASVPSSAAALFENRCKLRQRIFRLVRPQRKTKSAVVVSAMLAMVMIFACFTTACQPTPDRPPVANKNGLIATVLAASGDKEELEKDRQTIRQQIEALGGRVKTSIDAGRNITISVDAQISAGLEPVPLVRVRPENLSKEQFEAFMDCITGGKPVYYDGSRVNNQLFSYTKEEIDVLKTIYSGYLANEGLPEDLRNNYTETLAMLDEQYETAAGKADDEPYDGTLTKDGFGTYTYLKCYMGSEEAARFYLAQPDGSNSTQMSFYRSNHGLGAYNTYEPYEGVDAPRIGMPYEEAKSKAEAIVRKIDGEDSSMVLARSIIGYDTGTAANYTKENAPQCYTFLFERNYNGVAADSVDFLWGTGGDPEYSKRIYPESFLAIIDDEGVSIAVWQSYTKIEGIISEDVPLMDLDSVLSIFEQHCGQKFGWAPEYENSLLPVDIGVTFNVKKVELNVMLIPEKDNPGMYITVPVWDFIADEEYDREVPQWDGSPVEGQKGVSIVTINAIDGSVIDRTVGY